MYTEIEFYDKDILKNILGVFALHPDKVVYMYDRELSDMNVFVSLENCFKRHMPDIIVEYYPVDVTDIELVCEETSRVIKANRECVMNLTGGSELMILAGYKAARANHARLVFTDIIKGHVVDLTDKTKVWPIPKLSLTDFFNAKGASVRGNSHDAPEPPEFDRILAMCRVLFSDQKTWKALCSFIQTTMAKTSPGELYFKNKNPFGKSEGKFSALLFEFRDHGFIRNLNITRQTISFEFSCKTHKAYLISYGVWLELYVYVSARKSKAFDDVLLGIMIDWDIFDKNYLDNEIDVVISDNSVPVFVSCKFCEANTSALNELLIEKKMLGGWFSKGVIVTFGREKAKNTGTYQRAQALGLELLDK